MTESEDSVESQARKNKKILKKEILKMFWK